MRIRVVGRAGIKGAFSHLRDELFTQLSKFLTIYYLYVFMNSTALIIIYLLQHNEQFRVDWYSYKNGQRYSDDEYIKKLGIAIY